MASRRIGYALGIVALLFGAYALYWHWMAARLQTGIENWVKTQQPGAERMISDWAGVTGFPFNFEARFQQPIYFQPLSDKGLAKFSAPAISLRMRPWNLRKVHADIDTPFEIEPDDPGKGQALAVRSDDPVTAEAILGTNGQVLQFHLRGRGLSTQMGAGAPVLIEGLELTISGPEISPKAPDSTQMHLSLTIGNLVLPESVNLPTGRKIDRAAIAVDLLGNVPSAGPKQAFMQWRDNGGTLEVRRLEWRQTDFSVAGDLTFAFDEELQPLASGSFEVEGMGFLLDRMVEIKAIEPGPAALAKAAAAALEYQNAEGKRVTKIGLSVQGGVVRLGPVALARLPKIDW